MRGMVERESADWQRSDKRKSADRQMQICLMPHISPLPLRKKAGVRGNRSAQAQGRALICFCRFCIWLCRVLILRVIWARNTSNSAALAP